MTACTKDTDTDDTTPPPPPPPPTNTEMLTGSVWQVKELIQQRGNTQTRYLKNGLNNTGSDYSVARLVFNTDGTGSFTDPLDDTYPMTWQFAPGDETKVTLIVDYGVPVTLNYAFVNIKEDSFTHTIYYEESGTKVLATVQYIPVP